MEKKSQATGVKNPHKPNENARGTPYLWVAVGITQMVVMVMAHLEARNCHTGLLHVLRGGDPHLAAHQHPGTARGRGAHVA